MRERKTMSRKRVKIKECLNPNCDSKEAYVKEVGFVDDWYGHAKTYIVTCVKCKSRWRDDDFHEGKETS